MKLLLKGFLEANSRLFLISGSLSLIFGAVLHQVRGREFFLGLSTKNLTAFEVGSMKALWHSDTAAQSWLAVVVLMFAFLPSNGHRLLLLVLTMIPFSTGIALYVELGPSYIGGHSLMVSSILLFIGGLGHGKRL